MARKDKGTGPQSGADENDNSGGEQENVAITDHDPRRDMSKLPILIHSQYIKDLSFENPNAPLSFKPGQKAPQININFSMDAKKLQIEDAPNAYEVTLQVQIVSERENKLVFLVELEYGIMCSINEDMPDNKKHFMLLTEMPHYAFPFVREIIAHMTSQAGFKPLLMTPVNFRALYRERFANEKIEIRPAAAPEDAATKTPEKAAS